MRLPGERQIVADGGNELFCVNEQDLLMYVVVRTRRIPKERDIPDAPRSEKELRYTLVDEGGGRSQKHRQGPAAGRKRRDRRLSHDGWRLARDPEKWVPVFDKITRKQNARGDTDSI